VYGIQAAVTRAKTLLEGLAPQGTQLNEWFVEICRDARAHKFDPNRSNQNWHAETRPILEGFWHCSYFMRMLARYGRELDEPPGVLPFGWAAVLYLYGLR
jgi:hypothetical protein